MNRPFAKENAEGYRQIKCRPCFFYIRRRKVYYALCLRIVKAGVCNSRLNSFDAFFYRHIRQADNERFFKSAACYMNFNFADYPFDAFERNAV